MLLKYLDNILLPRYFYSMCSHGQKSIECNTEYCLSGILLLAERTSFKVFESGLIETATLVNDSACKKYFRY